MTATGRRRYRVAIPMALLGAGALVWSCRRPAPPLIWCVGDSITRFYAPALAEQAPQWRVVNHGVGGERSDEGLVRLRGLLDQPHEPIAVVVLLFGANDLVAGMLRHQAPHGPADAARQIRAMADAVRRDGAVPLVALPVGSPRPTADLPAETQQALRTLRRGAARLRRLLHAERPHVDLRLDRHDDFLDAVHPTPAGVATLVRRAAAGIRRTLRARPAAG